MPHPMLLYFIFATYVFALSILDSTYLLVCCLLDWGKRVRILTGHLDGVLMGSAREVASLSLQKEGCSSYPYPCVAENSKCPDLGRGRNLPD